MLKFTDEDLLLYEAINHIDEFPSKGGGEGKAYFIGNDLVVKRYFRKVDSEFEAIFEDYCKEMQKFAERGMNVPKIYSWAKIPNFNRKINPNHRYDYYILQDRVKGRELFYGYLEDIYPVCKKICSRSEFFDSIKNPETNRALFKEILKRYVADYIRVNEYLCSIPESQIDKFLYDIYVMCLDGKFSLPDMFPANIFLSKDKISIIDNHCEEKRQNQKTKEFADTAMTSGLVWLFFYNSFLTSKENMSYANPEVSSFLIKYRDKVAKPCKAAMIRFIKRMNAVCSSPKITNKKAYVRDMVMVGDMLTKKDAEEVFSNFCYEM